MYTYTVVGGPSHCYIAKTRIDKMSDEPKKNESGGPRSNKASSVQFWSKIEAPTSNNELLLHKDEKKSITCIIL